MSDKGKTIIKGFGPGIRIKVPTTGKVTVITDSGAKTVTVDRSTLIQFAA